MSEVKSCEKCPLMIAAVKIVNGGCGSDRKVLPRFESYTDAGKLIATECKRRGITLSALGKEFGFSSSVIPELCRGVNSLRPHMAKLIGEYLGIDLRSYIGSGGKARNHQDATEPLPFLPGPCAAERAVEAS